MGLDNSLDIERQQAIIAGERALKYLQEADSFLNDARLWGNLDLLGDDVLFGLMKHSKIKDANRCLDRAKENLRVFKKELEDIHFDDSIQFEVGSFLAFADIFFDDIFSDIMVQSKIRKARTQVNEAKSRVIQMLAYLRYKY